MATGLAIRAENVIKSDHKALETVRLAIIRFQKLAIEAERLEVERYIFPDAFERLEKVWAAGWHMRKIIEHAGLNPNDYLPR